MLSVSEKSRARLQAKQQRLNAHTPGAATALLHHYPIIKFRGQIIGGFYPLPDEIDLTPLLQALSDQDVSLALPCTPRKGHPLTFRSWRCGEPLKSGPYGTKEPTHDAEIVYPDIVLVPLLAFTEHGERLGYGGGFYDRTLSSLKSMHPVFACGVAYDGQKAAFLPTERHDIRLDAILTPSGFREFAA